MSNDPKIVAYIVDQAAAAGDVTARPMFGEYGLYCGAKMVGIIGEGQLFIKVTAGSRAHALGAEERSPYPGAKPCLLIDPSDGTTANGSPNCCK